MSERIEVDAEPISEGAQKILEEGGALVRIENMTQMTVAVQKPRDIAKIKKAVLAELITYPESAWEAIYSKPVGGGKQAEGLSVRAAEALAYAWGNNAFAAEILADDGMIVSGVAIYLDYEMNTRRAIPFRVSRKYKSKAGPMKITPEDRFNDVVIPAKVSKVLREVILRSLPPGIKAEYEQKAREIMRQKGGDRWGRVVRHFSKLGIGTDDLEKKIGKDPQAFKDEDFETLMGIHNAIMEGETTVAQAFGKEVAEAAVDDGKAKVTMGEILGSGGKLKEGEKPGEKKGNGLSVKEYDEETKEKQKKLWGLLEKKVGMDPVKCDELLHSMTGNVDLEQLHGAKLDAAIFAMEERSKDKKPGELFG